MTFKLFLGHCSGAVYAAAATGVTNTVTVGGAGHGQYSSSLQPSSSSSSTQPPASSSRKRKILESSGNAKLNAPSMRPPGGRRTSEVDDDLPLHTPQCSQSGELSIKFNPEEAPMANYFKLLSGIC